MPHRRPLNRPLLIARVHASEALGRDTEPIKQMNLRPAPEGGRPGSVPEAPCGSDKGWVVDTAGRSRALQATDELVIFHDGHWLDATDRVIDPPPHEDSTVSV